MKKLLMIMLLILIGTGVTARSQSHGYFSTADNSVGLEKFATPEVMDWIDAFVLDVVAHTPLDSLENIAISMPDDKHFIRYNPGDSHWVNGTLALEDCSNVNFTGDMLQGQVLKYNLDAGVWENSNEVGEYGPAGDSKGASRILGNNDGFDMRFVTNGAEGSPRIVLHTEEDIELIGPTSITTELSVRHIEIGNSCEVWESTAEVPGGPIWDNFTDFDEGISGNNVTGATWVGDGSDPNFTWRNYMMSPGQYMKYQDSQCVSSPNSIGKKDLDENGCLISQFPAQSSGIFITTFEVYTPTLDDRNSSVTVGLGWHTQSASGIIFSFRQTEVDILLWAGSGGILIYNGSGTAVPDVWAKYTVKTDLDNNLIALYRNGVELMGWTSYTGATQCDMISLTLDTSPAFFDNIELSNYTTEPRTVRHLTLKDDVTGTKTLAQLSSGGSVAQAGKVLIPAATLSNGTAEVTFSPAFSTDSISVVVSPTYNESNPLQTPASIVEVNRYSAEILIKNGSLMDAVTYEVHWMATPMTQ